MKNRYYIWIVPILCVVIISCSEIFSDHSEIITTNGDTLIQEAQAFFEKDIVKQQSKSTENTTENYFLSPGNFTPDWNASKTTKTDKMTFVITPILSDFKYKFTALSCGKNGGAEAYSAPITQKLLVIKHLERGVMGSYIVSFLPTKSTYRQNKTDFSATLDYAGINNEFSGVVTYSHIGSTPIRVDLHQRGVIKYSASLRDRKYSADVNITRMKALFNGLVILKSRSINSRGLGEMDVDYYIDNESGDDWHKDADGNVIFDPVECIYDNRNTDTGNASSGGDKGENNGSPDDWWNQDNNGDGYGDGYQSGGGGGYGSGDGSGYSGGNDGSQLPPTGGEGEPSGGSGGSTGGGGITAGGGTGNGTTEKKPCSDLTKGKTNPVNNMKIRPTGTGRVDGGDYKGRSDGSHDGIDVGNRGDNVYATHAGTIETIANNFGPNMSWVDYPVKNSSTAAGNKIYIKSVINGQTYYFKYMHLESVDAQMYEGRPVKAGELIGIVGSTGSASSPLSGGAHLHYEIRLNSVVGGKVNPHSFIFSNYSRNTLGKLLNNGIPNNDC